jgi:hypothetical protein
MGRGTIGGGEREERDRINIAGIRRIRIPDTDNGIPITDNG